MKLLVVLCTLAVCAARIPESGWMEEKLPESREVQESAFQSQKEYTFVYNGQLLTGIPSSSKQHSGSRIEAVVSLTFKTQSSALLQIRHVRMGHLNRKLSNPRVVQPFMVFMESPISQEKQSLLQRPVKFNYENGLVRSVVFDGSEEPWSANLKRGILNLLQVNLKKSDVMDKEEALVLNEMRRPRPAAHQSAAYNVMENTLEGECETMYTVVSEPHPSYSSGQVMNVSKSINFENCKRRPQIKYNFRFSDPCPSCKTRYSGDEKFLKSSSIFHYNISGSPESFLIEKARVESHYVLVPFNEESSVIITYVNQTLELVGSRQAQPSLSEPRNPVTSDSQMIYTPDWDVMKERFFMEGDEEFLQKSPYPEIENNVQFLTSILRKLVTSIGEQVGASAPQHFNNLITFCRILTRPQLEKIWKQFHQQSPNDFTPEQHKKIKSLLVDALAAAGTKNTVQMVVEKIKNRQISPLKAAMTVKSFGNIRVVSKDQISLVLSLAESEVSRRSAFLKQSVYLTAGSMMNALCSPNEDRLAMEFKEPSPRTYCPRQVKEQYVQLLKQKLESEERWEDKVLYLKSMSNAGLDLSIFELEKIIRNEGSSGPQPTFLRAEAVLALRQLKDFMPRKVQRILMPIFMNRYEAPELRIMSAYQILQTLPPRQILDQMTRRLFAEPSRQVTSFVFSYMHTMANSTNPCERKLSEDMGLSLRHSRFPPFAFLKGYSKFLHRTSFSEKLNLGVDMDMAVAYSNSSYIPRFMGFSYNPVFGGFWARHFATVGLFNEGFEQIYWKYFGERGYFYEKPLEEILRRSARSAPAGAARRRSPSDQLKDMFTSLRIRPREYFPRSPKALLYFRFKDQEFGFLPFSFDSMPEELSRILNQGQLSVSRLEQALEEGYNMCVYKGSLLHELSYKIPTTFGVPINYRASVPTVMSLTGQIRGEISPERSLKKVKLTFTAVKPSVASSYFSHMESWSPIMNSGLKVEAQVKAYMPLNGHIEMDMQQSPPQLKINLRPQPRQVDLFSLVTRPSTYTFVWPPKLSAWIHPEEKTVMGDDWTRVRNFDHEMGEHSLGIKMRTHGYWHRTPSSKLSDTPYCPLSGPNRLSFSMEPGYQMPKDIEIKVSGSLFRSVSEAMQPEFSDFDHSNHDQEEELTQEKLESLKSYSPVEPSQHSLKVEVEAKGGPQRKISFQHSLKCDRHYRYCRASSRMERSPVPRKENQPFKFCMDGEVLLPEAPQSFSELVGKKAIAQMKMSWGASCDSDKYIRLNVVGGRSSRQIQHERQSPEYRYYSDSDNEDRTVQGPVFQYQHLAKHADLMEYSYHVDYNNVPVRVRNMTSCIYRYFKSKYFCQVDEARIQVQNPQNQLNGLLSLDPKSQQYLNVSVKMPGENATFQDIPIRLPMVVNVRHSRPILRMVDERMPGSPYSQNNQPMCHVSSRYIQTFDGVKYRVPLSSCFSVLAKDCGNSEDLNFGVYMKQQSENSQRKIVKVLTAYHVIVLAPESDDHESVKVEINGQKKSPEEVEPVLEHGHVVARVDKVGKYVQLHLPEIGVSVHFDGYSASVKVSPLYRSVVCGLCGHYDHESSDEFRMSNNELSEDVREFYRSYTLPEDSCSVPEISEICPSPSCEPSSLDENEMSSDSDQEEEQQQSEERDSIQPVMRTKVVEYHDQVCFSKVPVSQCPEQAHPESYKPQRRVAYSCLSRDDSRAESLLHRLHRESGVLAEVSEYAASFTETEQYPESCSRVH